MEKKKSYLSLFADGMILYIGKSKESMHTQKYWNKLVSCRVQDKYTKIICISTH